MRHILEALLSTTIIFSVLAHAFGFSLLFRKHAKHSDTKQISTREKTLNCTCGLHSPNHEGSEGSPTPPHFLPWDVLITLQTHANSSENESENDEDEHHCKGTLINDRVILTSVKCIVKLSSGEMFDEMHKPTLFPDECVYKPEDLVVSFLNEDESQNWMKISKIYYHPKYLTSPILCGKTDYDIALLALETSVNFTDSLLPVCIPSESIPDSDLVGQTGHLPKVNDTVLSSPIYSRSRCRVNSGRKWISERFLCTLAPPLTEIQNVHSGTSLLIKNYNTYTQHGIHSWSTYFPMIFGRRAITLSTNIHNFIKIIDEFSDKVGAKWCKQEFNDLPPKPGQFDDAFVNGNEFKEGNEKPWEVIKFGGRDIRKSCKCGRLNSELRKGRIQGGEDAPAYEYGWMVQLLSKRKNNTVLCGGTVINSRVVVTAAHCVLISGTSNQDLINPDDVQVSLARYKGPGYDDEKGFVAAVDAIIPHPGFSRTYVTNDIALIILSKPFDFRRLKGKVSPICFPEKNDTLQIEGRNDAKVIGWGRTKVMQAKSHAENLQQLQVKIISNEECHKILKKHGTISITNLLNEKKVCAGNFKNYKEYKDPGRGDSGSPLFVPKGNGSSVLIHVGIASLVTVEGLAKMENSNIETVTVYTRSEAFIDFVDYYSHISEAYWCQR